MVDFAGWEMPVQYSGVIAEHLAVRSRAGLFDVSHMGEIAIRGAAEGMIRAGILKPDMDIDGAIKKIYREYEGVNDEWINGLDVEKVAMGQIQPNQTQLVQQELATIGSPLEIKTCCNAGNKAMAAKTTP